MRLYRRGTASLTGQFRAWLKFNAVGIVGIGVQLLALTILKSGLKVNYLIATFIAVETAVLHNFVWHERWTWLERTRQMRPRLAAARSVSSCERADLDRGNLFLMWVRSCLQLHLHYFLANLLAIGSCSVV